VIAVLLALFAFGPTLAQAYCEPGSGLHYLEYEGVFSDN